MVDKKKFDTSKPHVNVGTIGHVDHGKTTLVAAITTVLAKQGLAQKKTYTQLDDAQGSKSSGSVQRGKTINATHEEFETEKRHYSLIDCPGHEHYIKNMITGTVQMDGAILLVSAVDGTDIQTRKHMDLAQQIGVKYLVVFINKIDATDPMQVELAKEDVKEELKKRGWEGFDYEKGKWKEGEYIPDPKRAPIIMGSALCAAEEKNPEIGEKPILQLLEAIDNHIPTPERDIDKPFLMWIESKYDIENIGTVVTGPVKRGKVKKGDKLALVGLGLGKGKEIEVTVKGIESHRKTKDEAVAGDDVGILLGGVKFKEVERGRVLATPGTVASHTKILVHAYINKPGEGGRSTGFGNGFRPQFFFETADVTGTIKLAPDKIVKPGDDVSFEIDLGENDVIIEKNSNFIIWEGNISVGKGVVTEIIE